MRTYLTVITISLFVACTQQKNLEQVTNNLRLQDQEKAANTESKVDFNFSTFVIDKARIGPIRIGMTITQAEKHLKGLPKGVNEATAFGYGGGGPAYIYNLGRQPLLALIPKLNMDTILLIIAAHKDLKTTNGLNPNSTVADLLEKYPSLTINQDLMNS